MSDEIAILRKKILEDPIYGPAYRLLGNSVEAMFDAGFFDDGAREESDIIPEADDNFFLTPVAKIRSRLESAPQGARLAVLLMTGSFCPVHTGHIESLEIAREELEARGIHVLGGFLSPSHDSYVSVKLAEALSAPERLDLCQAATADSDWITADPWESLGVDRAVNFTDVIVRLERYLRRHVETETPIDVYYVFSSDHARFCRAFVAQGHCVCTVRPDYRKNVDEYRFLNHVRDNDRIIWAMKDRLKTSSGMVRDGSHNLLPGKARTLYESILRKRAGAPLDYGKVIYRVRDEGPREVQDWFAGRSEAEVRKSQETHLRHLMALLCRMHREIGIAHSEVMVTRCDEETAKVGARRLFGIEGEDGDEAVISIDAFIAGDYNLGVSRCFPLAEPHSPGQISRRPGYADLVDQIATIPKGRGYRLVDDDIDTGRTITTIRSMLEQAGITISGVNALVKRSSIEEPGLKVDVLDSRDFIAGTRWGGLVIELPDGKLGRVPYCLPYCSPSQRASIPLSMELQFSLDLWNLNRKFFERITEPVLLKEADPSFRMVMEYFGFSPDTTMERICWWHVEQCRLSIERFQNSARPAYDLPARVA